ncbi:hypothetical protein FDP41_005253 [Naegleria fowleri]|uniref:Actin n=1 Tax=Naegleria fowleri TaxID=5763 RepID=A0A6A5BM01_NAEFO|nr:uncharacterized protein FDP41_005253 [Naegleria fowleri]KAF0975926.1 hypothetical protein FDP41_005253 [Naegleria fowleri]
MTSNHHNDHSDFIFKDLSEIPSKQKKKEWSALDSIMRSPIEHGGHITNWEDFSFFFKHLLNGDDDDKDEDKDFNHALQDVCMMKKETQKLGLICSEPPQPTKSQREQLAQLVFEELSMASMFSCCGHLLSMFAHGITTGCVLDVGHTQTSVVSVYEGFAFPHSVSVSHVLGGRELTEHLKNKLKEKYSDMEYLNDDETVRTIKESCGCVKPKYDEVRSEKTTTYELPDEDIQGIDDLIQHCIQRCDIDFRLTLFENIVLSGGSTMFKGIDQKIVKELEYRNHLEVWSRIKVKSNENLERKNSAWTGASIIGSLSTMNNLLVSKEEYDEQGPDVVHAKSTLFWVNE